MLRSVVGWTLTRWSLQVSVLVLAASGPVWSQSEEGHPTQEDEKRRYRNAESGGEPSVSALPGVPLPVPYASAFPGNRLILSGSDLIVTVTIDPEASEGTLLIKDPGVPIESGEFTFDEASGLLSRVVSAPSGDGGVAEPAADPFLVEVEVTLRSGAFLNLQAKYSEIDVVTTGAASDIANQGRATVNGTLTAGRLAVRAPVNVTLNLRDGEIDVIGTPSAPPGPLRLDLHSSEANLSSFGGTSRVASTESMVAISDATGVLEIAQQGGQMTILGSSASLRGGATKGSLDVEGYEGQGLDLKLVEVDFSMERSTFATWSLDGRDTDARLVQTQGQGSVTWSAGSIGLESHAGVLSITLNRSANMTAAELRERFSASVTNAELELASSANVSVTARSATVNVSSSDTLTIDAANSDLNLRGFARQGRWTIQNSTVDADFGNTGRRSHLKLDGQSTGTVALPSPCFVQFSGRSNLLNSEYKISGCEVLTADPTQRKRLRFGGLEGLDGTGGTVLQLDLDDEASVVIGES